MSHDHQKPQRTQRQTQQNVEQSDDLHRDMDRDRNMDSGAAHACCEHDHGCGSAAMAGTLASNTAADDDAATSVVATTATVTSAPDTVSGVSGPQATSVRKHTGPGAPAGTSCQQFHIQNMDCPVEEKLIRNKLEPMAGVVALEFNLMARVLEVRHTLPDPKALVAALASIGMQATVLPQHGPTGSAPSGTGLPLRQKLLLLVSGLSAAAAEVLAWSSGNEASLPVMVLVLLSILSGGLPTLRKGWIALKTFTLNINFLMTLAVLGALLIGQLPEAAMVLFLFALAELIESLSLDRARNAVSGLLALAPEIASVKQDDGHWQETAVAQVPTGSLFRVRAGERIALDGTVVSGTSAVNQAPITGESMPVEKAAGDPVYAGSINEQGLLEVRSTSDSSDSTLARIARTLEQTQSGRAPTQRFVDTFARYYTPVVVLLAVLVALVPPVVSGTAFIPWIYKALVLLVIACPCALVISTPVTIVSGLTAAARRGILVKGGQFLEAGHGIRAIALDKTGTLTLGQPRVVEVRTTADMPGEDVLLLAASLEAGSQHPLAKAIVLAAPDAARYKAVDQMENLPGRGVRAMVDGLAVYLGNSRLVNELGQLTPALQSMLAEVEASASTAVVLVAGERVQGVIAIADVMRENAAAAVARLGRLGVHTVMLTGDNQATAELIGRQAGVSSVAAGLLPEEKLEHIRSLQSSHGKVGMLGDGINDAPALAQADIGFAMGAAGSDTAIETADVALMDDDPDKLATFVELARATRRILLQNIALALGIKLVFFLLALAGMATLWMAVFADVGASLLVVANGLRLLRRAG